MPSIRLMPQASRGPNHSAVVNLADIWQLIERTAAPGRAFEEVVDLVDACLGGARAGLIWADNAGTQAFSRMIWEILGLQPGQDFDMRAYATQWVHPDDQARYQAERAASYGDKSVLTQAYRVIRPDGRLVHIRTHGQFYEKDGRLFYRGLMRDATREFLSGQESEAQLTLLADAFADEPVSLTRVDADLRITWAFNWPQRLVEAYGGPVGIGAFDFMKGPGAEALVAAVRQTFATGEPATFEGRVEFTAGGAAQYRSRFTAVPMPDGSRQVLAMAYNLTRLIDEQADKQLSLLTESLRDEPVIFYRINKGLRITWTFNWFGPAKALFDAHGSLALADLFVPASVEALREVIYQAIETGQPTSFLGTVEFLDGHTRYYRGRYVPTTLADGTVEVLVKAYSLSELISEQADKQLNLVTEALKDEPVFFYRIKPDLVFTWQYNFPEALEAIMGPLVGQRLTDLIFGPSALLAIKAIKEAFETGQPTSFEGPLEGRGIGTVNFRARYVPIAMPDGSTEVFAKNYNLTALVSQQADKQLALIVEALQDEPVVLYRMNRNLEYTWRFNSSTGSMAKNTVSTYRHLFDSVQGPGAESLGAAIRHAIDSGEVTAWEDDIEYKTGKPGAFPQPHRARYRPRRQPRGAGEGLQSYRANK